MPTENQSSNTETADGLPAFAKKVIRKLRRFEACVTPWAGEGLPPVGIVCEWHGANHDGPDGWIYSEGEVVGYSPCGLFIFMQNHSCWPVVERLGNCEFRPICTPEQIEAKERDDFVSRALFDTDSKHDPCARAAVFRELYDAGYRKQVAP